MTPASDAPKLRRPTKPAEEGFPLTMADRESAAHDGSVFDSAVPLLHLLWLPLAAALIGFFAYAVAERAGYPFPLEWLEPATPDTVARILHGLPIYCAPSYEFVASMKTPLYYYVVAALAPLLGADLLAGRLVSILSTAGTCCILWRFIRREGGSNIWALFGIALFLATYNISRQWYDIARLDALFLLILVAAAYALRFWRGTASTAGAGLLLAAAYFTKQTVLIVAIPVLLALAFAAPRRALLTALAFAVPVLIGMTVLHDATQGWSTFFLVEVPRHGELDFGVILSFWSTDLRPLWPALLCAIGLVAANWRSDRAQALFYAGLLLGALLCGWLGLMHVGGTSNALLPSFAVLALMMPLALQRLLQPELRQPSRRLLPLAVQTVALLQLALLTYDPRSVIPDASDREAGDQLQAFLRGINGDVLVMDDRYFSGLAGKSSSGLDFSVADLLRVKNSAVPEDFKRSIIEALHAAKFAGIVDPPDFVVDEIKLGPPVAIPMPPISPGHIRFRPRPAEFYAVPQ
jgi:Dolichyl-phosphate-mannose-protein mannosyltransferase